MEHHFKFICCKRKHNIIHPRICRSKMDTSSSRGWEYLPGQARWDTAWRRYTWAALPWLEGPGSPLPSSLRGDHIHPCNLDNSLLVAFHNILQKTSVISVLRLYYFAIKSMWLIENVKWLKIRNCLLIINYYGKIGQLALILRDY